MIPQYRLVSLLLLIFAVVEGLSASSLIAVWLLIELSTLCFIGELTASLAHPAPKEVFKFYIIQSIGGIGLLLFTLAGSITDSPFIQSLTLVTLLFNIGNIPFQSWLLSISNNLNWESLFIFLSLINILPLVAISGLSSALLLPLAWLAFLVAALCGIWVVEANNLFIWSSLYFGGIVLLSIYSSILWIQIIATYIFLTAPFPLILQLSTSPFRSFNSGGEEIILMGALSFILMNMAGIPPLPGFFLNFSWLIYSGLDSLSIILFCVTSASIVFIYANFSFAACESASTSPLLTQNNSNLILGIMSIFLVHQLVAYLLIG